jgi:DNA-directed RNA polymerase subunit RPC12/RpoP
MVKRLKTGQCPNCKKTLFRRRSIKIKKKKPTKCEYCGFVIEDPYKIFTPVIKNER